MNEKKACLLKAQRVVDDKAQSEEIMLRVNRVMRTEGREVLESDVSNEELKTLMRHFGIPQKVAKLKVESFKVWRTHCVENDLFTPAPASPVVTPSTTPPPITVPVVASPVYPPLPNRC